MKNYLLSLALFLVCTGAALADNQTTAIQTAREIANCLELHEAQYLKIRLLEEARLKETQTSSVEVAAINKKYTAAVLEVLNDRQKVAFQVFAKAHPSIQIAQVN
ncbi:hypothetical protein [Rufibacter latericius]|uniref:Uncharacterized protein n=1 Tax=Rufibacter latericius TaxID=2487040 RepID=A0A3M9MBB8_9BACT|nr:hypothetical protein [Rufibacter latericius]RNI21858.1 hypothetical protein EFB08_22185 [Rufibacter latericius]